MRNGTYCRHFLVAGSSLVILGKMLYQTQHLVSFPITCVGNCSRRLEHLCCGNSVLSFRRTELCTRPTIRGPLRHKEINRLAQLIEQYRCGNYYHTPILQTRSLRHREFIHWSASHSDSGGSGIWIRTVWLSSLHKYFQKLHKSNREKGKHKN